MVVADAPASMKDAHLAGPVLEIVVGTTFNDPRATVTTYLPYLKEWEPEWVTRARIDTRPLAQLFGHPAAECFHLTLPRTIAAQLGAHRPPHHLAPSTFTGFAPNLSHLGGDGRCAGPYLAAAHRIDDLHRFLDDRVSRALEPQRRDAPLPGDRQLLVIVRLFTGSSTGPGVAIPVLLCIDDILRARNIPKSWRVLVASHPDRASGVGHARLSERQATTLAFHSSLDTLHRTLEEAGRVEFQLGTRPFIVETPLVNEVVYFGGDGPSASLSEELLTDISTHVLAAYITRNTGVGRTLEDDQQRARVLLQYNGHRPRYGASHACGQVLIDLDAAAKMLSDAYVLDLVEMLLSDEGAAMPLSAALTNPGEPGGPGDRVLAQSLHDDFAAAVTAPPLPPTPDPPSPGGLDQQRASAEATVQATAASWRASMEEKVTAAAAGWLDQAITERIGSGQLGALAEELGELIAGLQYQARDFIGFAEGQLQNKLVGLNQARTFVLDSTGKDNQLRGAIGVWDENLREYTDALLSRDLAAAIADVLRGQAERLQGGLGSHLDIALGTLRDAVHETEGELRRAVDLVNWNTVARPLPSRINLWNRTVHQRFFDKAHDVRAAETREINHDELSGVLVESGAYDALQDGDGQTVISLLRDHGYWLYRDELDRWRFSEFVQTFIDRDLGEALREPLTRAWEAARGWVRLTDVAAPEEYWYVETPKDDLRDDELFTLATRGAPDGVMPKHVRDARREGEPGMIIWHTSFGLSIDDLAGPAERGPYRLRLLDQRKKRDRNRDPIFPDPRLEDWADQHYPELKP